MTDLSHLGASTRAVWTRAQALEVITRGQIASLLYDGAWQSPFPGVYADGGYALDPVQLGFAGVLASGFRPGALERSGPVSQLRAVACGRTAARVCGMALIDDDDPATGAQDRYHHDVAVWRSLRDVRSTPVAPEGPVDVLHRHQLTVRGHEVARHSSGLWLTVRERTLLDLAPLLSLQALVCAIDRELNRGLVRLEDLEQIALERKGCRWAPRFAEAVALADAGAQSPAETLGRLLLQPELPNLRTQVPLFDRAARMIACFDLADEQIKLAFETDGKVGHAGEAMVAKDRRRDARTGPYGWWTERATWYELRRQPDHVRRRVLAVADRRRLRLS